MAVKFSDFTSSGLNSTGFIVGYDSGTNQNIRIPKSTLDSTYQPTLISGTNIRTINSTSLLGSGNVEVQPTLVSGTNIKTINSTSLLGSGNVAVQPTLVSGSNIKTINGNSVLGSGDLIVSGGGASGIHGFVTQSTFGVTAILTNSGTNTASPTSDTLYTYPLIMVNDYTFNSIEIYCQSALVGGNCRILLYSNLNSNPDQKLYESTTIDLSTTGTKTITTTMTLTKGTVYWVVFHCGNGGAPLAVRSISSLTQLSLGYRSNNAPYSLIQRNATAPLGSAPTTFGAYSPSSLNSPLVAFF